MAKYRVTEPKKDRAAAAVLAAYEAAQEGGLPSVECYRAGVEAWRRAHPRHAATYAAQQAVNILLEAKTSLRIEDV
jgi:hypothetical protein